MTTPPRRPADETTIREALREAEETLRTVDPDTARLDAEVLLAHALSVDRAGLYTRLWDPLPASLAETFEKFVKRRAAHEPIAYITNAKEFYGLNFYVDRRVLIPRPETERLVERTIEIAHSQFTIHDSPFTIIDVGTGSGCIVVALALNLPRAEVYATEASEDAIDVARTNVKRHAAGDRVHLIQSDLLRAVAPEIKFDVIVANLPYVAIGELPALPQSVHDYEPVEQALAAGSDGLDLYRRLLEQAPARLRPGGVVLFEIGWTQGASAATLAQQTFPDAEISVLPDLAGRDRVVEIRTRE